MTNLYDYVLSNEDALVFYALVADDEEKCAERISVLEPLVTGKVTVNEDDHREYESRLNEQRVLKSVIAQHLDQVAHGPMISFEVRYDLTEPLQNALVAQLAYATRQRDGYARIVAMAPEAQEIRDAYNAYRRQVLALEEVIKQVGRHV